MMRTARAHVSMLRAVAVVFVLSCPAAKPAYGLLVGFDSVVETATSRIATYQGFLFEINASGWVTTRDQTCCVRLLTGNGTAAIHIGGDLRGAASIRVSAESGEPFSVTGFDAATSMVGARGLLDVIGTFPDTATTMAGFALEDAFNTFVLSGFTALHAIEFRVGQPEPTTFANAMGLALDNLVIRLETTDDQTGQRASGETALASVPEPGTLALLGPGLIVSGLLRRRRCAGARRVRRAFDAGVPVTR